MIQFQNILWKASLKVRRFEVDFLALAISPLRAKKLKYIKIDCQARSRSFLSLLFLFYSLFLDYREMPYMNPLFL